MVAAGGAGMGPEDPRVHHGRGDEVPGHRGDSGVGKTLGVVQGLRLLRVLFLF